MNTRAAAFIALVAMLATASPPVLAGWAQQPLSFLGSPAPPQAPVDRIIVLTDATRHVNVTSGETVRFIVGERAFSWSFDRGGTRIAPFDLRRIAPKDLLNHPVTAYVAEDPLYQG